MNNAIERIVTKAGIKDPSNYLLYNSDIHTDAVIDAIDDTAVRDVLQYYQIRRDK